MDANVHLFGATASDKFTTDWCKTEGECGTYSYIYGYWDYCQYLASSKPDWLALDWKAKQEKIWKEVNADPSPGAYHPQNAFTESMKTTFQNQWDVLPAGRDKVIHGIGSICPFSIEITEDSPFTGMLKPGLANGLMRLAGATDWTKFYEKGLVPGVAIKFLRSGTHSANILSTYALEPIPHDNFDYFAVTVANHVPDVDTAVFSILGKKFCTASNCATKLGLSDLCTFDQDGNNSEDPIFPFKIAFEAADVHFQEAKPKSMEEFMAQFDAIEAGSAVYKVRAFSGPEDTEGTILGKMVTTDKCVRSHYGDTKMFFKHQQLEDDIALRPEWKAAYYDECHCEASKEQ